MDEAGGFTLRLFAALRFASKSTPLAAVLAETPIVLVPKDKRLRIAHSLRVFSFTSCSAVRKRRRSALDVSSSNDRCFFLRRENRFRVVGPIISFLFL